MLLEITTLIVASRLAEVEKMLLMGGTWQFEKLEPDIKKKFITIKISKV